MPCASCPFARLFVPTAAPPRGQWRNMPPPGVPVEAVVIDWNVYKRLRCAGCGRRGLEIIPQHNVETGGYRVKATCLACKLSEAY